MKKNLSYYLKWLLLLLANLSLLGGCVKKKGENQNSTRVTAEENVFRLNFDCGDLPSLLPHDLASTAKGLIFGKMLFEGLTRMNPQGEYALAGAEKVEVSPCQTRYLFTLRSNHYSDGMPVLATDYEHAWKRALSTRSKCEKAYLFYCIENAENAKKGNCQLDQVGIKALSDTQLLVKLNAPIPYFLELLSSPLFAPFKEKEGETLGSGPYRIEQWNKGDCLSLKSNLFFWDQKNLGIKKIKILAVQDTMTAFHMKEKGEIDWVGDPFSSIPEDLLALQDQQGKLLKTAINRPFWLYFNTECSPLSSPLIRQALNCAIDRRVIAKHIYLGSEPLFTVLPGSLTLCKDERYHYDLLKGKQLFEEGLKELGLTRETFPPITFSSCQVSRNKQLAQYLQESWQTAFGIQVHINVQEWNVFFAQLQQGNYQIGGTFVSSDYNHPLCYLERLAHPNNFPQWKNSQFTQLIEQAKQEVNPALRSEFLREAELIIKREAPLVSLVRQSLQYSHIPELKGYIFNPTGIPDLRWAYFEGPNEAKEKSTPPS